MFKTFLTEVENQFNRKIKRFRSDRGQEYESTEFVNLFKSHGIIHETTAPYSPEMNGKAERKNRTLCELTVATLLSSGAASYWWGEIVLTVCYVLNRIPNSKTNISPYEIWKNKKPNVLYFRTWGCLAYVRKPDTKRSKLASRAFECVFIGYACNSKAYRFYDLKNHVIIESLDADFYENKFPFNLRNSGGSNSSKTYEPTIVEHSQSALELRKSKRARIAKDFGPDFHVYNLQEDPNTIQEALTSLDVDMWQEAINDEMDSLESNQTWHLVDLPPGCKTIGCKWILKRKLKPDGSVEKFKARLVAKGYRQRENIDFFDTYSPVTRITSIRVLFALASIHDLVVHQMDVKTAFLNGELEEEIYMDQPEGFIIPGQENKVYLGEASVILGLKITRSEHGFSLDQSHYIEKLLRKYNYFDCKPACTPYDPSVKLFKNTGDSVKQSEYASIIGSLRYATDCTRPDISYAVGVLCRFTSKPSLEHWHAIERLMRYLKRTMNFRLHYEKFPAVLEGYSDADWNTLSDDSKATSGYIFNIGGGAVSWKSKKQTILAQSTMESELIALATASEEAGWLRNLLSDTPLWEKPIPVVLIHCDSTAAIAKVQNRYYNGKRRQIRRKHNTVRDYLSKGAVRVDHIRSEENLADPLMKGLAREKVWKTSKGMGLKPSKN
ncbi:hypothetical protein ACFX13_033067 [Malus domestica]